MRTSRFPLGLALACLLAAAPAWAQDKPPAEAAKQLYEKKGCLECHGADGRKLRWETSPIIAGQNPRYSYLALQAYKSGARAGGGANLHVEVSDLISDEEMRLLADYVATLR